MGVSKSSGTGDDEVVAALMLEDPAIQDLPFGEDQKEEGERHGGPEPGKDLNIEKDCDEAVDWVRKDYLCVDGGGPRYAE